MILKVPHYQWHIWFAWRPVKAKSFDEKEYYWVWLERIERMTTPGLSRYRLPYWFWMQRDARKKVSASGFNGARGKSNA